MELKELCINNFLSVDHVKLDLKDQGLLLITGHSEDEGGANGVGKSTVGRNALCYVLFGETVNGDRGDILINDRRGENLRVNVVFQIGDVEYRVLRKRRPNCLEVYENGMEVTRKTAKETQELINTILGTTKELFLFSDVFGQGKKSTFLELTPGDQKNLIEEILPLEQTNDWLVKTSITEVEIEMELRAKQEIRDIHNGQLIGTRKALESIKEEALKWEEGKLKKLGNLQIQLTKTVDDYTVIAAHIETLKTELKSIDLSFFLGVDLLYKTTEQQITEDKTYKEILIRNLETFKKNKDICLTCQRPITTEESEKYLEEMNDRIEKKNFSIAQRKIRFDDLIVSKKKYEDLAVKQDQLKREIDNLEKNVMPLCNKTKLEQEIETLNNEESPFRRSLDALLEKEGELIAALLRLGNQLLVLQEEKTVVSRWKKAYGKDIPLILFNMACPFLEEKTNEYLSLLNNGQITVKIDTIKELKSGEERRDFSISVRSDTGGSIYSLLSGGEQQIVNFAASLALSDLAEAQWQGSSKFAILDEPFTNLDPRNSDNVLNFLTTHFLKKKKTVILISNEERLKQSIPNKIELTKKNGMTIMENNNESTN